MHPPLIGPLCELPRARRCGVAPEATAPASAATAEEPLASRRMRRWAA
jgi:hypothetical protein